MSRRALVTGGAGFLGAHLCRRLLAEGWEVRCVDNLSTGLMKNLVGIDAGAPFTFVQADIAREPLPDRKVDAVLHLACPASPTEYARSPIETLRTCAEGTARTIELAERAAATFILASTSEVYGDPLVHPQREDYVGNVDPIGPRSMYDEGKRFAEALTTWHRRERGTDARIVRIFNTYGPGMSPVDGRAIPTFIRQARAGEPLTVHGDGHQTRSHCFVDDLIEGLFRVVVAAPGVGAGPINLGNPQEVSVLEVARTIVRISGSSSRIVHLEPRPGDPSRRRPDISRARSLLGWEPGVAIEEGLAATIGSPDGRDATPARSADDARSPVPEDGSLG
jgi:dTDP-glucose 4,6-dehydratase